jgi:glycosyltransferase involved in cell wall biosynthesis
MQQKTTTNPADKTAILQVLPRLESGGVERGTLEIVEAISHEGMKALVASAGGTLASSVSRAGGEHITLPLQSKNPWVIWRNASRLCKLIKQHDIALIHARSRAPAWSAYIAAKRMNIPFVTTFHGIYGHQSAFKNWYNSVMVRGEKIIAVSEFVRQHVIAQYHVPASKVVRIDRGVDFKRFNAERIMADRLSQLSTQWRLPDDASNVILAPGRITRIKGQHVVLAALARLKTSDFICVFLGNSQGHGQYVSELQALIDTHGLSGKVRMVPHTSYMAEAYALSSIVLMPSLKPEAFGRVVVEAQAMGKLVIASAQGGAKETIIPNETGYLVQPNNPVMLAEAIDHALARTDETVQAMAEYSISNVRAHYSITKMKQATIRLYKDVLSREKASETPLGDTEKSTIKTPLKEHA